MTLLVKRIGFGQTDSANWPLVTLIKPLGSLVNPSSQAGEALITAQHVRPDSILPGNCSPRPMPPRECSGSPRNARSSQFTAFPGTINSKTQRREPVPRFLNEQKITVPNRPLMRLQPISATWELEPMGFPNWAGAYGRVP